MKHKPAKKKPIAKAFWDDDEDSETLLDEREVTMRVTPPEPAEKPAQKVAATTKPVKTPAPALPPLKPIPCPVDFHDIRCGSVRVVIIDTLDTGFRDLLCYNWELKCTMHLKREDLAPKDTVDRICNHLLEVRK